ncbi:MAG: cation:proton antiporter [Chloroflexota bacterium]
MVIAAAKLAGFAANRLGQPAVMGELLIGLILGPSVIGLFDLSYFHDTHVIATLSEIGEIGVIFLMFAAGLEIQRDDLLKAGRPAVLAGVLGVVVPVAFGTLAALPFGYDWKHAAFIGIVLSATSVSITAQTLMELNRLRSREGITLLGAAVVDDVLAIAALSAFIAVFADSGSGGIGGLFWVLARMILFLVGAFFIGQWLLPRIAAWADRLPVSEGVMTAVIVMTLSFAWASEVVGGVAAITGAFIAGVALGRSHLRKEIADGIHTLAYSFFVPVFLISIGLAADFRQLSPADYGLAAAVCLVAIISKLIGSGVGAKLGGMTWPESWRVGAGMVSRGEVGLIVAGVGVTSGFIQNNVFAVTVVMVLFTTLAAPIMLRAAFQGKEK